MKELGGKISVGSSIRRFTVMSKRVGTDTEYKYSKKINQKSELKICVGSPRSRLKNFDLQLVSVGS